MTKVFLSYAHDDHSFAHRLSTALKGVKIEGWMGEADIASGLAKGDSLRSAIKDSNAIVVLVSPSALERRWVEFEIGAGLGLGKPIIPILIGGGGAEADLPALGFARAVTPASRGVDPEEALAGDELEGFVERHDLTTEGAWVAPGLAAPPQHLNVVALAGRA